MFIIRGIFICALALFARPAFADSFLCKGDFFPTFIEGDDCNISLVKLPPADTDKIWAVCESSQPCEIRAEIKKTKESKKKASVIYAVKLLSVTKPK